MDVMPWLLHRICVKDYRQPSAQAYEGFDHDDVSTQRFFNRFERSLDFAGEAVLDIGCGAGARRVVGVDLYLIDVARTRLETRHAELAGTVELIETDGTLTGLDHEQFDVILSKDSFEHYADPEGFIDVMTGFSLLEASS